MMREYEYIRMRVYVIEWEYMQEWECMRAVLSQKFALLFLMRQHNSHALSFLLNSGLNYTEYTSVGKALKTLFT